MLGMGQPRLQFVEVFQIIFQLIYLFQRIHLVFNCQEQRTRFNQYINAASVVGDEMR